MNLLFDDIHVTVFLRLVSVQIAASNQEGVNWRDITKVFKPDGPFPRRPVLLFQNELWC